jgi:hypothetical protein
MHTTKTTTSTIKAILKKFTESRPIELKQFAETLSPLEQKAKDLIDAEIQEIRTFLAHNERQLSWVNIHDEEKHVFAAPKSMAEKWNIAMAAKRHEESYFTSLAKMIAVGQVAAESSGGFEFNRSLPTRQYYAKDKEKSGDDLMQNSEIAQEFDNLIAQYKASLRPSFQEECMLQQISEWIKKQEESLNAVAKNISALETLLEDKDADLDMLPNFQNEIDFLKNTLERMSEANSIDELRIYKDSFKDTLRDLCLKAEDMIQTIGPNESRMDFLIKLNMACTQLSRSVDHYYDVLFRNELVKDEKEQKLCIKMLGKMLVDMIAIDPLVVGTAASTIKKISSDAKECTASQSDLVARSYAEKIHKFCKNLPTLLRENKAELALSAAGIVGKIFPLLGLVTTLIKQAKNGAKIKDDISTILNINKIRAAQNFRLESHKQDLFGILNRNLENRDMREQNGIELRTIVPRCP